MPQTMLEKALAANRKALPKNPTTMEEVELALEWFRGRLTLAQVAAGLGVAASSSVAYRCSTIIQKAMVGGMVSIELKK